MAQAAIRPDEPLFALTEQLAATSSAQTGCAWCNGGYREPDKNVEPLN